MMRVAILGAGAMGSVFGGHLALAGHDVTLVDLREDHVRAIRERGLLLRRPDANELLVRVEATSDPKSLATVDAVIVLVKSYATGDAIRSIWGAISDETWVVTLQNGLGNDVALAEVVDWRRVIPGTTTVGAEQHGLGETTMNVSTANGTSQTHFGAPRSGESIADGVTELAGAFSDAGLPTTVLESADTVIWTKLALAGCMGPISAILRRSVRDVIDDPYSRSVLMDMYTEIVAVAHGLGIPLDYDKTLAYQQLVFDSVGPHMSSMAADLLAHRRTEIDAFCGEVVRLGEKCGVPTPVNSMMWRLIRATENSYDRTLGEWAPA